MKKKIDKIINLAKKYNKQDLVTKSAIWFTIVNSLNLGIGILLTPILTRMILPKEFGTINIFNTWSSIFSVIFTLALYNGILEILLTKNKQKMKEVTFSLLLCSLLINTICFLIMFIFKDKVLKFLNIENELIFYMFLNILSNTIIIFWITMLRFMYKYKLFSFVIIIASLFRAVLSIILVVKLDNNVYARIMGMILPNLCLAILIIFYFLKSKVKKTIKYWKEAVSFNIVLIPHYLSGIILGSSDQIMISKMIGFKEAGIYSLVYKYSSLTLIIFGALNSAFAPFAYSALEEKNYKELNKKAINNIYFTVIVAILVMIMGPELIKIMAPSKYLKAVEIIPILVFGIYLSYFYSLFSYIAFIKKKNKFITLCTLISGGLNIFLNYLLLPIFGYKIAAVTTFIGYLFLAIVYYILYIKLIDEKIYDMKKITFIMFKFLGMTILIIIFYKKYVIRYFLVVLILIYYYIKNSSKE